MFLKSGLKIPVCNGFGKFVVQKSLKVCCSPLGVILEQIPHFTRQYGTANIYGDIKLTCDFLAKLVLY